MRHQSQRDRRELRQWNLLRDSLTQLARCKDCAGRDAKLVRTCRALELAARGDFVGFVVDAMWANCFAISLRPAHFAEQAIRRVFASFVDAAKVKCAGCR